MKYTSPMPTLLVLLFTFLSPPTAHAKTETIASVDGTPLCCEVDYYKCKKRCAPKDCLECAAPEPCVRRCEKATCSAGACNATGGRTDGREMRGDGRLTGPGEVKFVAFNRSDTPPPLQVIGLIHARTPQGQPARLKMSETVSVLPGDQSRFSLRVSPEEFAQWTRSYGTITVGLTYPDLETAQRWRFENLLTAADIDKAMPGEFLVRGAFHPQ